MCRAAKKCPIQGIVLRDRETGRQVWPEVLESVGPAPSLATVLRFRVAEGIAHLPNNTEVLIRRQTVEDVDGILRFYDGFPREERERFPYNVTDRDVLAERIALSEGESVRLILAIVKNSVVAAGDLQLIGDGDEDRAAELRVLVGHDYRGSGLGRLMAHELYAIAATERVRTVTTTLAASQTTTRAAFEHFGFKPDPNAGDADHVLLRADLGALWREMEDAFERIQASAPAM